MIRVLPLALLFACGIPAEKDAGTAAVFPHPANYADVHGADAIAFTAACQRCHDLVEDRGSAKACRSCHTYPHEAGWSAGAQHGAAWRADVTTCADCHGADGARAPQDVAHAACTSCHPSYPHAEGWGEGTGHGAGVLARGGDVGCQGCHGADGAAIAEGTCTGCHAVYPHADGWSAGAVHGAAWLADSATCGSCHDATADTRRVACSTCHDVYPHAEGWTPTGHVPVVQARGEAGCLACHADADAVGPSIPVGCAPTCHTEAR